MSDSSKGIVSPRRVTQDSLEIQLVMLSKYKFSPGRVIYGHGSVRGVLLR